MNWAQWFTDNGEIIAGVSGVVVLFGIAVGFIKHWADQRVKLAEKMQSDAGEELARCKREHEEQVKSVGERHALQLERVRSEALEARSETDLASKQAAERREAEMRSMIDTLGAQVKGLRRAREQDDARYEEVAALRLRLESMDDGAVRREELEALRVKIDRLATEPSATAASLQQVEAAADGLDLKARASLSEARGWAAISDGTPESLDKAIELFQKALEIKPESADAYCGWGNALYHLAKLTASTDTARDYYEQACEKYEQALKIKPGIHEAFNSWATVCIHLSHLSEGEERAHWLAEAERLAAEAEAIEPGPGNYNLACVHALQEREDEAFAELREALEGGHILWSHVAKDPDWDDLREHPEYKKLAAEFGGED